MNSLYKPGASLIHRIGAGWKLLGLFVILLSFAIQSSDVWIALARLAFVIVAYLVAAFGLTGFMLQLNRIKLLALIVLVPQLIFNGVLVGLNNTISVISGVLLAALVSMTTKTSDIVKLIERLTKSRALALLIALSINSIALVTGYAEQILEASKARGVKPKPVRQIINLFVVSLRNADQYGEALAARGVEV